MKNIIYLRVSKEGEGVQDLEAQKKAIIEKFQPMNPIILQERGSAYKLEKINRREGYFELMNMIFDAQNISLDQLFKIPPKREQANLYLWDYSRIMRNIEYSLIFQILSDLFGVNIFTYKDGKMKRNEEETPSEKLGRYMMYAIQAYSSEEYSYNTSKNIQKAFTVNEQTGTSRSIKENLKIGPKFRVLTGKKVNLSVSTEAALRNRIKTLLKSNIVKFGATKYGRIVEKIEKEYGVVISKAYISRIRNNVI